MSVINILTLAGGLGMFLFGMNYMGVGLEAIAGQKMNDLMEKLTRNPFFGFLLGMFVTAIIQSSSATTVMVMGLINAGIMDLAQATGVIIGANIGTTVTSILIAMDVTLIAPVCIFIGAIPALYSKKNQTRKIGQAILGFGILFQGLHTMSSAMACLKDSLVFQEFIQNTTNPIWGIFVGTLLCAIIQSSSASVGVLQALAMQNLMPIHLAAFILCGIEIGSSVPPFLSSIHAKNNAKRAAYIYFIFNVIGCIIFAPISAFTPYTNFISSLTSNPVVQISIAHIIFKVVTGVILLPFTSLIVKLTYIFVPQKDYESEKRLLYIDKNLISNPAVSIKQVMKETERMSKTVRESFLLACNGLITNQISYSDRIKDLNQLINFLNQEISDYLIKLNNLALLKQESEMIGKIFHVITYLVHISDHAINILNRTEEFIDHGFTYSEAARQEIQQISETSLALYDGAINMFFHQNSENISLLNLKHLQNKVYALSKYAQEAHIQRLKKKECHIISGVVFFKVLQDLERVGSHSYHIAQAIDLAPNSP